MTSCRRGVPRRVRRRVGLPALERRIAQADPRGDVDGVEQFARLFAREHRGLASLATCFGPHQPVEPLRIAGEVLLDDRLLEIFREPADVGTL